MGAIRRRKVAIKNLRRFVEDPDNVYLIHYSQSKTLDDDYGGISAIITSIVIKSLSGQTDKQFAIHFEADKADIQKDDIHNSYRDLELRILKSFNDFVRQNPNSFWVHWDMKNIHFGFEALKHRFEKIFSGVEEYCEISAHQKRNLRTIIEDMYGDNFANGPDFLKSLMVHNNDNTENPFLISSEQESSAFQQKNFDAVVRSVDTKVDFIKKATTKLCNNKLLVINKNTYAIFVDFVNHPIITFIGWIIGIVGLFLAFFPPN